MSISVFSGGVSFINGKAQCQSEIVISNSNINTIKK